MIGQHATVDDAHGRFRVQSIGAILFGFRTAEFEPATPEPHCGRIAWVYACKVMRNRTVPHLNTWKLARYFASFEAQNHTPTSPTRSSHPCLLKRTSELNFA